MNTNTIAYRNCRPLERLDGKLMLIPERGAVIEWYNADAIRLERGTRGLANGVTSSFINAKYLAILQADPQAIPNAGVAAELLPILGRWRDFTILSTSDAERAEYGPTRQPLVENYQAALCLTGLLTSIDRATIDDEAQPLPVGMVDNGNRTYDYMQWHIFPQGKKYRGSRGGTYWAAYRRGTRRDLRQTKYLGRRRDLALFVIRLDEAEVIYQSKLPDGQWVIEHKAAGHWACRDWRIFTQPDAGHITYRAYRLDEPSASYYLGDGWYERRFIATLHQLEADYQRRHREQWQRKPLAWADRPAKNAELPVNDEQCGDTTCPFRKTRQVRRCK